MLILCRETGASGGQGNVIKISEKKEKERKEKHDEKRLAKEREKR